MQGLVNRIYSLATNIITSLHYYFLNKHQSAYKERPEIGPVNMKEKKKRLGKGDVFEWPNIVTLNKAVSSLITNEIDIINIGAGTATLEQFIHTNSKRRIVSSEQDMECIRWNKKNRNFKNVTYISMSMAQILKKFKKFDIACLVEVVEHIDDYANFLKDFSKLANKAIVTTPNRARDFDSLKVSPPRYKQHVREWTAGEFYWVLRVYYKNVKLYSIYKNTDKLVEIGINSRKTPLVAYCTK